MADKIVCSECGTEHEAFSKFCKNCGAELANQNSNDNVIRCSNCGAELNNEAFCPDCGKATGITICPNCRQKTVNQDFCSVCGYRINQNVRICANCGNKIDAEARVCAHCGFKVIRKSPFVAFVLSLIFPGLGQLYNSQNHKGITLIIGYIISWILSLILIGIVLALLIWVYGMYDAYVSAKAINNGESLEDKVF